MTTRPPRWGTLPPLASQGRTRPVSLCETLLRRCADTGRALWVENTNRADMRFFVSGAAVGLHALPRSVHLRMVGNKLPSTANRQFTPLRSVQNDITPALPGHFPPTLLLQRRQNGKNLERNQKYDTCPGL